MRKRNHNSYSTITEIIEALNCNDHTASTWVGKDYTKKQLIEDLTMIHRKYIIVKKNGEPKPVQITGMMNKDEHT